MLDEIVERTKERIDLEKSIITLDDLKREISYMEIDEEFPFKKALQSEDISIIAEVKKASPSKGLISEYFDYIQIAKDYEDAEAKDIVFEYDLMIPDVDSLSKIMTNLGIEL